MRLIHQDEEQIYNFNVISQWIEDSNYPELFSELLETEKVFVHVKNSARESSLNGFN